jgi:hypothetical protein
MSRTRPSLEPLELVLVDDVDVDELSAAGPLEDDSTDEVSDCADAVVTLVWVTPPKLDAPGPPPQAVRLVRARASWARMGINVARKGPRVIARPGFLPRPAASPSLRRGPTVREDRAGFGLTRTTSPEVQSGQSGCGEAARRLVDVVAELLGLGLGEGHSAGRQQGRGGEANAVQLPLKLEHADRRARGRGGCARRRSRRCAARAGRAARARAHGRRGPSSTARAPGRPASVRRPPGARRPVAASPGGRAPRRGRPGRGCRRRRSGSGSRGSRAPDARPRTPPPSAQIPPQRHLRAVHVCFSINCRPTIT